MCVNNLNMAANFNVNYNFDQHLEKTNGYNHEDDNVNRESLKLNLIEGFNLKSGGRQRSVIFII